MQVDSMSLVVLMATEFSLFLCIQRSNKAWDAYLLASWLLCASSRLLGTSCSLPVVMGRIIGCRF